MQEILDLYCTATGMELNIQKSSNCFNRLDVEEKQGLISIFPFRALDFRDGFKYLGFLLKPNGYQKSDWGWLLGKIDASINHWCNKWLSIGGRLTLIKSVLEAIPVFWHSFAHIPKGVLERIRKLCFRFLWSGCKEEKIPLVKWQQIAKPRGGGAGA